MDTKIPRYVYVMVFVSMGMAAHHHNPYPPTKQPPAPPAATPPTTAPPQTDTAPPQTASVTPTTASGSPRTTTTSGPEPDQCKPPAPKNIGTPQPARCNKTKYPIKRIQALMNNRKLRNRVRNVMKKTTSCRKIGSRPGSSRCPARRIKATMPNCVRNNRRQTCYVLKPLAGMSCINVGCRRMSCRGRPESSAGCVPGNVKTIRYYVWCPRPSRVEPRTMRLTQSCSCKSC